MVVITRAVRVGRVHSAAAAISKLKKRRFRLLRLFLFSASRAAYNYNRAVKITRGGPLPLSPPRNPSLPSLPPSLHQCLKT